MSVLWLDYVANDNSNRLLVTSSFDGVNWTHSAQVSGQFSPVAPALTEINGTLWLAYVGTDGSNRLLVTSTGDGVNWTPAAFVGGQSSPAAPALVGW
jgi:hypothetical protein